MADSIFGKLRGHVGEARGRAQEDKREREQAERKADSVILTKREVQGEWDAARTLYTTLGATGPKSMRAITANDLAQYRHNMRMAQSNFKGNGITARQVIDLASSKPLPPALGAKNPETDIDRARRQINMAIPVSAVNNEVRFITNAGPDSDVNRHHVLVRFNAFSEAANKMLAAKSKDRSTPKQTANWLRKQKLAFDCDCKRHRFFFRYISTIGNFNAGRDELGYPKIRNPNLKGVACKHVLRVMSEIDTSATVLSFLTKHMEKVHASANNTSKHQMRQAEADEAAQKQAARRRTIKTSEQRAQDRARAQERNALNVAAKKVKRVKVKPVNTRKIESALKSGKLAESDLEVLRRFGFSDKQIADKLGV
ncbi:hypothetical protein [Nitrosomonas marina]|uniref:SWIM-type domain-containing protein n=1 Tax=Nitrosomonas marina TaxID=917 RepID=A0A1H8ILI6_9PROT|nr:hypothetical protein [Nitrosomonas marina]SEN69770.1 hypothetical protein SAMN05216325_1368 [Nitrosomonas marina]